MADPISATIHGLALTLDPDGLSVRVSPGFCYTQENQRLQFDGSMSIGINVPGVTPVVYPGQPDAVANTFFSLYALMGSGVGALEIASGFPDTPYLGFARSRPGFTNRRYLGTGRTESGARFRSGSHIIAGDIGNFIKLDRGSAVVPTPARVLTLTVVILVPPVLQTINLSGLLPPTAKMVRLKVANSSNLTCYFSRPSLGAPTVSQNTDYVGGAIAGAVNTDSIDLNLDSDLTITMLPLATGILGNVVSIGAGTIAVEVQGYFFNR